MMENYPGNYTIDINEITSQFIDYSVHEALFLSEKEETIIAGVMQNIQQEYHSNIDRFSQDIIIVTI